LKELGIEPVHNLPGVGNNLQDHWQVRIQHRVKNTRTLNDRARGALGKAGLGLQYLLTRSGPLGSQPTLVVAFARSDKALVAPDMQIHVAAASYDRVGGPLDNFSGITSSTGNLRPESHGSCHIRTREHTAQPAILNNFLSTEGDREVAVNAVELVRNIVKQPAFKPYLEAEVSGSVHCRTRDEILDYVRSALYTVFHPVGTCKMGVDDAAVVDPQLQVRGLRGLRVVDASIMPKLISGNTAAPTVMIAEKAADLILGKPKSTVTVRPNAEHETV
jgi:choline dehydrogenase